MKKSLFLLLTLLVCSLSSWALDGGTASNPTVLPEGTSSLSTTSECWFKFTPTTGGNVTLTFANTYSSEFYWQYTEAYLKESTSTYTALYSFTKDYPTYTFEATAGKTYYLQVYYAANVNLTLTLPEAAPCDHEWSTDYTHDETYHWLYCTKCNAVKDGSKAAHTYSGNTCTVCGNVCEVGTEGNPATLTEGTFTMPGSGWSYYYFTYTASATGKLSFKNNNNNYGVTCNTSSFVKPTSTSTGTNKFDVTEGTTYKICLYEYAGDGVTVSFYSGASEETMQAAQAKYDLCGKVGYPKTTSATAVALKALIDGGGAATTDDAVNAAITNLYNETDIATPENGKWYTMTWVGSSAYYSYTRELNEDGDNTVMLSTTTGTDRAKFQYVVDGDNTYFKTSTGKVYRMYGTSVENAQKSDYWLKNATATGLQDSWSEYANLSFVKEGLTSPTSNTYPAEYVFGLAQIKGCRGTQNGGKVTGVETYKFSAQAWDGAGQTFGNINYTSWVRLTEVEAPAVDANMQVTAAKVATFVAPFAVTLPAGVEAFTAEVVEDSWVRLTSVEGTDYVVDGKLKAGTAVVLKSEAEVASTTFTDVPTVTSETVTTGCLTGNLDTAPATVGTGCYLLQNHEGVIGWYKTVAENTIGVNRCYLTKSGDAAREFFPMVEGTTGISNIAAEAQSKKDGKYLVNGKFVIVKSGKAYGANGVAIY